MSDFRFPTGTKKSLKPAAIDQDGGAIALPAGVSVSSTDTTLATVTPTPDGTEFEIDFIAAGSPSIVVSSGPLAKTLTGEVYDLVATELVLTFSDVPAATPVVDPAAATEPAAA